MSLKRFTNAKNLRGLGKPLLTKFFERFETELAAKSVTLPAEFKVIAPAFAILVPETVRVVLLAKLRLSSLSIVRLLRTPATFKVTGEAPA